jgi:membrane-associated phospholipid phosphatase
VGWELAVDWVPYQRATFVTPAFAGFVSGHSTFSRSGAEVLTAITGSAYFPGGLYQWKVPVGALIHEKGPSTEVTLQWATYRDASDLAGISRLYGGIHTPEDDFAGRRIGAEVGATAWALAQRYYAGTAHA